MIILDLRPAWRPALSEVGSPPLPIPFFLCGYSPGLEKEEPRAPPRHHPGHVFCQTKSLDELMGREPDSGYCCQDGHEPVASGEVHIWHQHSSYYHPSRSVLPRHLYKESG